MGRKADRVMASLRKRSNGNFSLVFWWKGKQHIKALGTTDEGEAKQIKKDAEKLLVRIKRGESTISSKLLADGFSIIDVLFGSPEIAARLDLTPEDNPLTIGDLFDGFLPHLKIAVGFDQYANSESWIKKIRGFLQDDQRVMALSKDDLEGYRKHRTEVDGVGPTSINKELGSLKAAIKWGIETKKLSTDPIDKWPSLKTTRQKKFEWKADIEAMIANQSFRSDIEQQEFIKEMSLRMVLTAEEMKRLVELARKKMPILELPLMVVCSSGIRRKELVLIRKQDFDPKRGTIIVGSKKQSKTEEMTFRTIILPTDVGKAIRKHHEALPRSEKMLFPIFGEINKTYGYRWIEYEKDAKGEPKLDGAGRKIIKTDKKGKAIPSKRKQPEDRRRAEKAGRLLNKLIAGTEFELMNGWHCLRHSFISICVAKGLTWEQIRGWVGHVSPETTRLYTHFNLTDSKQRMESLEIRF